MSYKILITNHALNRYRGSEVYCFFLAKELAKTHDVFVYTPEQGKVSERMKEFAVVLDKPEGEFDIILYNHNNTFSENFKAKCAINSIHGIFPPLEKPLPGMDAYVAISGEIRDKYKELNPVIIPNGINTEVFKPNGKKKRFVKKLLFLSNYKSDFSKLLRKVAYSLGMTFGRIGGKAGEDKFDIVDDLNSADIVVGLGRSALEAMSCGKKVIVADKRNYADLGMDGFLTRENVKQSAYNNFSGRAFRKEITFASVRNEVKKALKDNSEWERDYVLKNHDIKKIAEKYISLAEEILEKKSRQ